MLKGIDARQRVEFSASNDTEPKTVFVLKPLTSLEMMSFVGIENDQMKSMKAYLKYSIVEVKNYHIQNIDDLIDSLDPKTLGELILEINKLNNVGSSEAKNS